MQTSRDTYVRLGVRQQNLLRLEQLRRLCSLRTLFRRALLRCLGRDEGLTPSQRLWAYREWVLLPRSTTTSRHNTRCRFSGRARQAFRDTQLARMQFRQQMAEGRLLGYRLGRS
jgi:ribosomal protein S14